MNPQRFVKHSHRLCNFYMWFQWKKSQPAKYNMNIILRVIIGFSDFLVFERLRELNACNPNLNNSTDK